MVSTQCADSVERAEGKLKIGVSCPRNNQGFRRNVKGLVIRRRSSLERSERGEYLKNSLTQNDQILNEHIQTELLYIRLRSYFQ